MAFRVTHTLAKEAARIKAISEATSQQSRTILEAVGLQVLSWIWEDYRAKARGGMDPAGNKWAPIKRESMRSRLSKLQSYRNASPARRRQMIAAAMNNHEIGVDTGRLVNSLEFTKKAGDTAFEIAGSSITVGSAVKYAGHFDASRVIVDEANITDDRMATLEEISLDVLSQATGEELP